MFLLSPIPLLLLLIVKVSLTDVSPVNLKDFPTAVIIPPSGISLVAIEWFVTASRISTLLLFVESITILYSDSEGGGRISP